MVSPGIPQAAYNTPDDIKSWRKEQRQQLIDERLAIAAATRKAYADAVMATLERLVSPTRGLTVSAYWPIRGEPDLRPLAAWIVEEGGCFALPVVTAKAQPLVFRTWNHGEAMERGFWNIPVPSAGLEVEPDVVISPMVGFDSNGYRLGYGGGYYDRTLAAFAQRPKVIGVGYERARLATIFPQPHDIPMDMIVTQDGVVVLREETGAGIGNPVFNAAEKT